MDTNTISQASWQDFEKQLRTYVRGRVDPVWVDDIVSNILLRLVKNSDALQAADSPAAYVQRVSSNAVTDYYRRKAAEYRAFAEFKAAAKIDAQRDVAAGDAALSELSRCLFPFIEDLPKKYCDALTLTEIEQLSQKQAAERLGLSLSGLKSRVQRGRALLKRAVTHCCLVEIDRRGGVVDYTPRQGDCGKDCSSA